MQQKPGRGAGKTGTEVITGLCILEHRITGLVILGRRGWNGHTGTADQLTGCTGTDCLTHTEAAASAASVVWVNVRFSFGSQQLLKKYSEVSKV